MQQPCCAVRCCQDRDGLLTPPAAHACVLQKEKEKAKATKAQPPKSSPWIPKSAPPGKEVIYVGFNKE